ncbi:MAG: hypothetical protein GY906_16930 [bacterium]|nr:hypothetical protein [bacterium]
MSDGDSRPRACIMCDGIYLRFRGQMPCWDHVGEPHVLRTVTTEGLRSGADKDLFSYPELLHIRRSFMAGEYPYPEDCPRCALLDHIGVADQLRPTEIRAFHVEPSYYCHLSCPLCIAAKDRRHLEPGPHNLDPDLYRAFLERLLADGVTGAQYVYFEGRGDPLVNPHLGRIIADTKEIFPQSLTTVVSHGNYPFKQWMVECGLDILKLSVDGAWQESYETYRVGGKLETIFALMRRLQKEIRSGRSSLRVIWRYILFEWNDSDEELLDAARLAAEMGVELRFMRTHSEGRSQRFPDSVVLEENLKRLGIEAGEDSTFEVKTEEGRGGHKADMLGEQVAFLLGQVLEATLSGDDAGAARKVREALRWDPGLEADNAFTSARDLVRGCLPMILADARSPATLSLLAALCREWGDGHEAGQLIDRYLEIAPRATDFDVVQAERHLQGAIAAMEVGDNDQAAAKVCAALRLDPGIKIADEGCTDVGALIQSYLEDIVTASCAASTLGALAHLCDQHLNHRVSAVKIYQRYLEVAPEASNRFAVEFRIRRLSGFGRVVEFLSSLKQKLLSP